VRGYWAGSLLAAFPYAIREGLFAGLLFLILFRAIFRKPWLAAGLYVLVFAVLYGPLDRLPPCSWPFVAGAVTLWVTVLVRLGVLALITMSFVNLILQFPLSLDLSAWYARDGLLALGFVLALAGYGFWTSLDRRALAEA
jgi:hypothetical protein